MKRGLVLSTCCLIAFTMGCSEDESGWELVWEEQFNGEAGQPLNRERWTYDIGTGWGNAQLEYDTDRTENVSTDGNGNLAIVAREETYEGQPYTSGRINTSQSFSQRQGRFEARIRLPRGQGIWPAFWLLGSNFGTVGWPECGEIDILEYRGQEPRVIHGSLHGPGYSGGSAMTRRFVRESTAFDQGFHIFAVEWTEGRVTWLVDDVRYFTMSADDVPGRRWVFNHPFFIILNVAVGGSFVGSPDETTTFPQTMLVDWVRVYRGEP